MKATNRVTLICKKTLKSGHVDRFRVVVMQNNADAAKKEYERQGYTVFK